MYTLTTSQKAPLLDENDEPLSGATLTSSNNGIAYAENQGEAGLFVVAQAPGTATITATRGSETASLEVEVIQSNTFQIKLGAAVPK